MTTSAMRAVVCHRHGPPESLSVEDVPRPMPGRNEVLVRVEAAAVNFPDVLLISDGYQLTVPTPFVPGSEFAGAVVELGEDVADFHVGHRVFGAVMVGAFAEYVVAPTTALQQVPAGIDSTTAAGFLVAHATAYHTLRSVAEVAPGDWVVVLGAAGGVGSAAIDVALALGGRVIAAASTEEKRRFCLERGAEQAVAYLEDDIRDAVKQITEGGADVVVDLVGGPAAERALRALRWGGCFVTVGYASGVIPRVPLNLVLLKGVTVKGFEMRTFAEHRPDLEARDRTELLELLAHGELAPHIDSVHRLEHAHDALATVAERRAIGKVLVVPDHGDGPER